MIAIQAWTPKNWWETEQGGSVRGYFEAYGAVVKERETTGDPSAIPSGDWVVIGGGRSSPSNISDIVLAYTEVKRFLDRNATRRQAALVNFVYVEGMDYTTKAKYLFSDGSETEWLPEGHEVPLVPVKDIVTQATRIYVYDFDRFDSPELEEVAKCWGTSKKALLKREHDRVGRIFANFAGL